MSYCLSPTCPAPQNSSSAQICAACGATLRLHDRYLALKPIAQGGFGRTFLAVDEAKERKPLCVIKQFFPQTLGAENLERARELFEQEALRLKELGSHDQIPHLLDSLEQDDRQYLIQEFIDGQNLEQESAQGAFSEVQIRQLLNDLLPVLQFVHDRQVIHRDIKPANIIRRRADQKLVLVDLGAAKYATGTALGKTGTVIGSAEYTAPEQARGKAVFGSDLYSLGATCIHLLTQMSPFDLFDSSNDRWAWRDCLKYPVSLPLDRILHKMLESGTNRRYQTANQVLADLNPRTQPYPTVVSPVTRKPKTQSNSFDQHFDRRDELIAALEPETRSWQWDIANGKVQRVPVLSDLKTDRGGKVAPAADGRSDLVSPRSQGTGRVKSVLILALIMLFPLWLVVVTNPDLASRTGERSVFSSPVPLPATDDSIRTLKGSEGISSMVLSPDGQTLVSSYYGESFDKTIIDVWDLRTRKRATYSQPHSTIYSLAISPDNQVLVGSGETGIIKFWNLQTGQLIRTVSSDVDQILSVLISSKGQVITGSSDTSLKLWDLHTGTRIRTLTQSDRGARFVPSISVSPDGQTLASNSYNYSTGESAIKVWNLRTGQLLQTLSADRGAGYVYNFVKISSAGLIIARNSGAHDSGIEDSRIDVWMPETNASVFTPENILPSSCNRSFCSMNVSPDGKTLAVGVDTAVELRDLLTGKLIRTLQGHLSPVNSILFSRDGKTLISADAKGMIKIWKLP